MTHRMFAPRLAASLAALLMAATASVAEAAAAKVGVTAAVNPQVTGTPPGQAARTLVLGNPVYHNERIRTETGGLLQVLFVDGTTFTVGPGADLVIDSYVFDPSTGTGKITATVARGVLRFVGGKISKAPNAVEINTLQGTIGIRGAVVNIDARSPNAGKIMFEFGRSANFCVDGGRCQKLFQQGWLVEISPDNPAGRIRKTEASDITLIQQALAGRRGQQGGAPQKPTGGQAERYDVASVDTTPPQTQPQTGGLMPMDDGLSLEDIPGLLNPIADIATDAIINDGGPEPPPPEGDLEMFVGGLVLIDDMDFPTNNPVSEVTFSGDKIEAARLYLQFVPDESIVIGANITMGPTGDPSVATSTGFLIYDQNANIIPAQDPSTAEMRVSATPICTTCSFLHWGGWTATITTDISETTDGRGFWVAGTRTPEARLPTTGVATYEGSAHAVVNNDGAQYQASGDFGMTWNFAQRSGSMSITNFDTANVPGGVSLTGTIESPNGPDFYGVLTSGGPPVDGAWAIGAFINGPNNTAPGSVPQGVAGTWNAFGDGYTAAGVFGGTVRP